MSGSGEVTYEYSAVGGSEAGQLVISGRLEPAQGDSFTYTYQGDVPFDSATTDQAFVAKFNSFDAYTIYSNVPLTVGATYTLNTMADYNPCFRRGTLIRTAAGDIPVESLREGDLVILANGTEVPIIWLGHRKVNCARHRNPAAIWPILVREGAFAEGVPARDLYVSPGHAFFINGVLMQAEKLVNGATILQVETETVEYWHVELENHAIILAENLPAESYLDQGNRTGFANGGAFVEAHPDFQPKHWAETCAPLVFEGPAMEAAKTSLLARAVELGHEKTNDADLHVMADGKRIDPIELGESRQAFLLPAGAQTISLNSRSFIPAHVNPKSGDKRALGIRARRLQLDGVDIAMDDEAAFATGWHKHESRDGKPGARWTAGPTPMPANTRLIMIEHAGQGFYWTGREEHQDNVVALFA
jgi:hypothetical protein